MTEENYRLRSGFSLDGDTDAIGARLDKLNKAKGELRPEDIVEDARSKKSPLHNCFEWDDTEAANKYRLEQARYVIRSIEIIYEAPGETKEKIITPNYANLGDRNKPESYRDIRTIMSDKTYRERYVRMVIRSFQSMRSKYSHIKELSEVYSAIEKVAAAFER